VECIWHERENDRRGNNASFLRTCSTCGRVGLKPSLRTYPVQNTSEFGGEKLMFPTGSLVAVYHQISHCGDFSASS
jgi:hypothetical protein